MGDQLLSLILLDLELPLICYKISLLVSVSLRSSLDLSISGECVGVSILLCPHLRMVTS